MQSGETRQNSSEAHPPTATGLQHNDIEYAMKSKMEFASHQDVEDSSTDDDREESHGDEPHKWLDHKICSTS